MKVRSVATNWALGVALAVTCISTTAFGETPSDEADRLFREGQQLLDASRFDEACSRFERSQSLDPKLGTLLNLADCHQQLGRVATAYREFNEAAILAAQKKRKDREDFAKKQAFELERRLSRVVLAFAADANVAEIRLDDRVLDRPQWTKPIALDPGAHTFVFRAPSARDRSQVVTIQSEGTTQALAVGRLDSEGAAADPALPASVSTNGTSNPKDEPAASESSSNTKRTVGWVLGGVGVAAIGAGGYFGIKAISDKDKGTPATVADIAIGTGLVAVGVATYLILTSNSSPPPQPQQAGVRLRPTLGKQSAGFELNGAF